MVNEQQNDLKFYKMLKTINKVKNLTQEKATELIDNEYEREEFGADSKTKALLVHLIKYRMKHIISKNLEDTLDLLDLIFPKLYKNVETLDNQYSKVIRKPIFTRFGRGSDEHELSKQLTALPDEVKGELLKQQKTKLSKKHSEIIRFKSEDIYRIIQNNITSEDPFRQAIVLAIASGCRPIELFEQANFTVDPTDNRWVVQDFLAKKKGEIVGTTKPIIYLTASNFIEKLENMRSLLHEKYPQYPQFVKDDGDLISILGSNSNKAMKQIFENKEGYVFYSCRKIYGALSYHMFGRFPNMYGTSVSGQLWRSKVLGHKAGDLSTANNYATFELEDDDRTPSEITSNLTQVELKVQNIEERLENLNVQEVPVPAPYIEVTIGNIKLKKQFKIIEEEYNKNKKVNLTTMTKILSGKVPRSAIRLFYRKLIEDSV